MRLFRDFFSALWAFQRRMDSVDWCFDAGHCSVPQRGKRARAVLAAIAVLSLAACGWVDDTGIQSNTAPQIQLDSANAVVESTTLRWPFSSLDADGNIQRVDLNLQAQGRDVGSCGQWFTVAESAENLRAACQPSLTDAQCQVVVETVSDAVNLSFPALRYPVGLTYDLAVLDTGQQSTTRSVDVCIQTVSSPPVANADGYSVVYGEAITATSAQWGETCEVIGGTGVLANDSDDFDYTETTNSGAPCLTAELVSPPQFAQQFSFTADGGFTYLGDGSVGPGGSDTFSYRASDGVNVSDAVQVAIAVVGSNAPPVANDLQRAIDEDASLVLPVDELGTDPEGSPLRLASVSTPSHGTAEISNNALVYRPPSGFSGTTDVTFVIADAGGATDQGSLRITVRAVNDPPEVVSLPNPITIRVIDPARPGSEAVTATVRDDETPAAQLVVSADIDPAFARVAVSGTGADGRVSLVISPLANGARDLTVTVRDQGFAGLPAETSSRVTRVEVSGINSPPVAGDDTASTLKGRRVVVPVLDNDTDIDGQPISLVGVLTSPVNGTAVVTADGRSIRYRPLGQFSGTDQFTYLIRDSLGAEATGTVRVEVVNRAPVAVDDSFEVEGRALTSLAVLSNDSDPDDDSIRIISVDGVPSGYAVSISSGRLWFQSLTGNEAEVSFTYSIDDFDGLSSQATVVVEVEEEARN
ncbi:MAG: Ig-like domain-containing protein [Pseudomonadota bacterium]